MFQSHSNLEISLFKQTVETQIIRSVLWRLVWVCTVCLCPTKRAPGLYDRIWVNRYEVKVWLDHCGHTTTAIWGLSPTPVL